MSDVNIYCLVDPITLEVRYVGKTVGSICKRRNQHVHRAKHLSEKTHKNDWIRSLLDVGERPIVQLIETVTEDVWEEREVYWIAEYAKTGRLTNYSKGGRQPEGRKGEDSPRAIFNQQQVREAVTLYVLGCTKEQVLSLDPFKNLSEKTLRSWAQKETRSCDTEGIPTKSEYRRGG